MFYWYLIHNEITINHRQNTIFRLSELKLMSKMNFKEQCDELRETTISNAVDLIYQWTGVTTPSVLKMDDKTKGCEWAGYKTIRIKITEHEYA